MIETGKPKLRDIAGGIARSLTALLTGTILALPNVSVAAISPTQAGYIDVTRAPYGADSTGATDASDAIQNAINDGISSGKPVFLPAGDYMVTKSITATQTYGTFEPIVVQGSSADPTRRSRLVLAPNSPGFGDPASPKHVLRFWCSDAGAEKATDTYHMLLASVDIKIGAGNDGATALRFRSAEGTGIYDVTIDMSESGDVGIWGIPASGGSTHSVTIIGGRIGIETRAWGSLPDIGCQPGPTISGCTFINQREYAFASRTRGAMVMVGCRFVRDNSGPVVWVGSHYNGRPFDGSVGMVDCEVEFSSPNPANQVFVMSELDKIRGRSVYVSNSCVKNASIVYTGDAGEIAGNPNGWLHCREVVTDEEPLANTYRDAIYVDGIHQSGTRLVVDTQSVVEPPANLVDQHILPRPFPSFESPGAALITEFAAFAPCASHSWSEINAYRTQYDWSDAIQNAVDLSEIVFFPPGAYPISGKINLQPDTKLIGTHYSFSEIVGAFVAGEQANAGNYYDTLPLTPMIETADDPLAETYLVNLSIRPGFAVTAHGLDRSYSYSTKWMAGPQSIIRMVDFQPRSLNWYRIEYVFERNLHLEELSSPYSTGGFTFSSDCAVSLCQRTVDSKMLLESNAFGGDTRLITKWGNDGANLTIAGSGFDITSIDICNGLFHENDPSYTVTLTGHTTGGGTLSETYDFQADGTLNPREELVTIALNWSNLSDIVITSPVPFGVDNIRSTSGTVDFNGVTGNTAITVLCGMSRKGFEHYGPGIIQHPNVLVTGNGGGRWYNFWQHGKTPYEWEVPFVLVEGNQHPLKVYHCHMQHSRIHYRWKLQNARFVDIYNTKTENISSLIGVWNSDHIRIIGHGGLSNPSSPEFSHYEFYDTPNFLLACFAEEIHGTTGDFNVAHHCDNPLTTAGAGLYDAMVEYIGDTRITPDRTHRPIMYRRGSPRISGAGTIRALPSGARSPILQRAQVHLRMEAGRPVFTVVPGEGAGTVTVRALDLQGRTLFRRTVSSESVVRLDRMPASGVYLVQLTQRGRRTVSRFRL